MATTKIGKCSVSDANSRLVKTHKTHTQTDSKWNEEKRRSHARTYLASAESLERPSRSSLALERRREAFSLEKELERFNLPLKQPCHSLPF